jgi:hypothetical protein
VTMSQRDALAELRAHRPVAPAEVRERVRLIAAGEPRRPRRFGFTWRRAGLVLAPALVVVVAATIALRGGGQQQRELAVRHGAARTETTQRLDKAAPPVFRAATPTVGQAGKTLGAIESAAPPASNPNRVQDYDAYLRLRVHDGNAVSAATKRAQAIARRLGGYASLLSVSTGGREGEATIRLRVPIGHVQDAVAKLSALGTIVGEQVEIKDLTAQVNTVDRTIARLQRRLADLRAQEQTDDVKRRIEALTRQVERLQRGRAGTLREASLATISVELTTREAVVPQKPHRDSRLDGAWTALGWIGIAALYAVIVGGPFLVLAALAWVGWRTARRRAEARLLEQV